MKRLLIFLIIALALSIAFNIWYPKTLKLKNDDTDTKKVEIVYDTIPYFQPMPVDSVVKRYVTVTLPVKRDDKSEGDTVRAGITDAVSKTVDPDSATVMLPITQKVYQDSAYKAYVSGYNPCLDSIFIFKRTEAHYIRSPTKSKRWNVGLQIGAGFTPKGPAPYIGIGISYTLFSF